MISELWNPIGLMAAVGTSLFAAWEVKTLRSKLVDMKMQIWKLEANIKSTQNLVYRSLTPTSYKGKPVTPNMRFNAQGFEIKGETEE